MTSCVLRLGNGLENTYVFQTGLCKLVCINKAKYQTIDKQICGKNVLVCLIIT